MISLIVDIFHSGSGQQTNVLIKLFYKCSKILNYLDWGKDKFIPHSSMTFP